MGHVRPIKPFLKIEHGVELGATALGAISIPTIAGDHTRALTVAGGFSAGTQRAGLADDFYRGMGNFREA